LSVGIWQLSAALSDGGQQSAWIQDQMVNHLMAVQRLAGRSFDSPGAVSASGISSDSAVFSTHSIHRESAALQARVSPRE
jgi:hypothetical protein